MKKISIIMVLGLVLAFSLGTAQANDDNGLPPILSNYTDVLFVVWDGASDFRILTEGGGESVTSDIIFTYSAGFLKQSDFANTNAYMIEPSKGFTIVSTDPVTGTITADGKQSDKINFDISNNNATGPSVDTQTVHFNILSDEDPGPNDPRTGALETTGYVDITKNLFSAEQLDIIDEAGHSVQVLVFSDVEAAVPIPAALPLFGSGLLGLGLFGWRRKVRS